MRNVLSQEIAFWTSENSTSSAWFTAPFIYFMLLYFFFFQKRARIGQEQNVCWASTSQPEDPVSLVSEIFKTISWKWNYVIMVALDLWDVLIARQKKCPRSTWGGSDGSAVELWGLKHKNCSVQWNIISELSESRIFTGSWGFCFCCWLMILIFFSFLLQNKVRIGREQTSRRTSKPLLEDSVSWILHCFIIRRIKRKGIELDTR